MEWLNVVVGPLSMAAGILLLLIVLSGFLWATGKVKGYDPINQMSFRDNTALGIRESTTPITDKFQRLSSPSFRVKRAP